MHTWDFKTRLEESRKEPSSRAFVKKSIIIDVPTNLTATMTPTFLSHLRSSSNLLSSPPPRAGLTIPSVNAHQLSRTVLITMGCCNFNSKSGVLCSCTSGSCTTSGIDMKGREECCDECGHQMSLHCDYSKKFTLQSIMFYWCLFTVPSSPAPHRPKKSIASRYPAISPRTKTVETLARITKRVELIGKKEFAAAALDPDHGPFVIHVATLNISSDAGDKVHPSRKAQIAQLKADEAPTEIPSKYADFADVFLPKLAAELPEHTGINDHACHVSSGLPSLLLELSSFSIKNQMRA